MKNILKSSLLLLCALTLATACTDDNDSNPTLTKPTKFVLNVPAAANQFIDLANSGDIVISCSQPDYGFPARTRYTVQVSNKEDMSNFVELTKNTSDQAKFTIPASLLASTLTSLYINDTEAPLSEEDFPLTTKAFIRVKANMVKASGDNVEDMEILSNVVSLNEVRLEFSLPPVTVPEQLYVRGNFNETGLPMVQVYEAANVFWHMVYIDADGIQLSQQSSFDEVVGFNEISPMGDLGSQITAGPEAGGTTRIASSEPGWYLMIVTTSVTGRKINYDVQFNRPEVWLIGVLMGGWDELMGEPFSIEGDGKDAIFKSAPFELSVPGDDEGGCVRAYVKVPGFDWWKSEFMVFDEVIVYRGMGGDQDRVAGNAGQSLYLNFSKDTGEIK